MEALYQYKTLNEVLLERSKETSRGITFITGSKEEYFVSYAELYQQALAFLGILQKEIKLTKGSEVVIYEEDNYKFLVCFWACLLGGYTPVPLAIGGKEEHKQKFYKVWKTLKNPHLFSTIVDLERMVEFGLDKGFISEKPELESKFIDSSQPLSGTELGIHIEVNPDKLAFIQFSSGSTGDPKGVMLTHQNLVYNAYDLTLSMDIAQNDTYFCWIPLTHDMGMIAFHLTSIVAGCNHIMMPTYLFIRRPILWMQKTYEHSVTKLCSPNFGYQYFLQALQRNNDEILDWDLSTVKSIFNGAEPISAKICNEFTTTLAKYKLPENCIVPSYGLAEASVGVSMGNTKVSVKEYYLHRDSVFIGNEVEFENEAQEGKTLSFVGIGKTLASCELSINDEEGNPLKKGTLGYIDIKGKNVTQGYYQNPKATEAVFTKTGWLRTGDLGFLLEDDTLVITGRHKNMMILQGQNYYAHDIEEILFGTADITLGKVAVCGIPGNADDREKLLVFVLFKKKPQHFVDTVLAIQKRLSDVIDIVPDEIIPIREVPKTTSGKVQHAFLLKKYQEGVFDEVISEVHNEVVKRTTEQWKTLKSKEERIYSISQWLQKLCAELVYTTPEMIDVNNPLSDQGFKSIHAVQLNQMVSKRLGVPSIPTILYKYPTINQFSLYLEENLFSTSEITTPSSNNSVNDDESLLSAIESMSEEEVIQLLND